MQNFALFLIFPSSLRIPSKREESATHEHGGIIAAQLADDACCNDSPTEYSETLPTLISKVNLEKYLYSLCLVGGMVFALP